MPKNKKPAGGRAQNFEPRFGKKTPYQDAKRRPGQSSAGTTGSASPKHRGYRAPEEGGTAKGRWTEQDRAGRAEARGIRSHSRGSAPAATARASTAPVVTGPGSTGPTATARPVTGPGSIGRAATTAEILTVGVRVGPIRVGMGRMSAVLAAPSATTARAASTVRTARPVTGPGSTGRAATPAETSTVGVRVGPIRVGMGRMSAVMAGPSATTVRAMTIVRLAASTTARVATTGVTAPDSTATTVRLAASMTARVATTGVTAPGSTATTVRLAASMTARVATTGVTAPGSTATPQIRRVAPPSAPISGDPARM